MNMNRYKYYMIMAVIVITICRPVFEILIGHFLPMGNFKSFFTLILSIVTFTCLISFVDYLDDIYLWRLRSQVIIKGTWDCTLDNPKGESIYSIIEIRQNRNKIELNGLNYLDKGYEQEHSTWKSIGCSIQNNELTYVYELKRHKDDTANHKKTGVGLISLPSEKSPSKLTGQFWDCSPNQGQGSITYEKRASV